MLILNETIRVDLIVFIAIFADVATIAIAYDNAPHAKVPVEWQLTKVWIISTAMGLVLAAGTWVTRATLFLNNGGIIQNFGSIQEILFLEVALTESWVIFITRMAPGKNSGGFVWPSWQLVGAVLGVDVLATMFCLFGWIGGQSPGVGDHKDTHHGWVSIVTVVRVWLLSFGVTVVVAFVYLVLNKISWLDDLGRITRSKRNEKMENFLAELQRLTLVHEGGDGPGHEGGYYRLAPGAPKKENPDDEEDDKAKKGKAKSAKVNKEHAKAKDPEDAKNKHGVNEGGAQGGSGAQAGSDSTAAARTGSDSSDRIRTPGGGIEANGSEPRANGGRPSQ